MIRARLTTMQDTKTSGEWITWVDYGVLRCGRCKLEEDMRGKAFTNAHHDFYEKHAKCRAHVEERPASSMTMREHVATQILSGFTSNSEVVAPFHVLIHRSVFMADALLHALRQNKAVRGTDPELSVETFEAIAERLHDLEVVEKTPTSPDV